MMPPDLWGAFPDAGGTAVADPYSAFPDVEKNDPFASFPDADTRTTDSSKLTPRQRYEAEKRLADPTWEGIRSVNDVGAIPAPLIEGALRYGTPPGWAQLINEKIAPDALVTKIGKGVLGGTSEALAGFTTPENLAALAIMPQAKLAQVLLAAGFEAEALRNLPSQIRAYGDATGAEEKAKIATGIAVSLGLPAVGAAHGLRGEPEVQAPRRWPQPDRQPEQVAAQSETQSIQESPVPSADIRTQSETVAPTDTVRQSEASFLPESQPIAPRIEAAIAEIQRRNAPGEMNSGTPDQPAETIQPPVNAVDIPASVDSNTEATIRQTQAENVPVEKTNQIDNPPPESSTTSTKNATTDLEREARGIEPAVEAAKRDFGTVWDEAGAATKADPAAPQRLVESLKENPRSATDTEDALLLRRQIEVQNEHDAAVRAVNEATDAGKRSEAQSRLERVRDDLQTVYDVGKAAGTATGRGLNARKMLARNDFTLAKMEAETRAIVNEGRPLSVPQLAEIKVLHERIKTAEAKVAAYEARDEFNAALKQAKADARKAGFKPVEFLDRQAERARERIVARRGKLFSDPLGVAQVAHLADEAIIGASHVARGVTKFADWSAQMVKEFGERIKPHLQALFAKSQSLHSEASKMRAATPEERLARALVGDKKRLAGRIEQIQKDTQSGNFEKPAKRPPRMDKEKSDLLFDLGRAKDAYNKKLIESRLNRQSVPRKAVRYAGEIINTSRAIKTSFDVSAVLRQGGWLGMSHPYQLSARNLSRMFEAMKSERGQHRINAEIMSRPNAAKYIRDGLLTDDSGSLSKMEEAYMSRWAKHIPGVAASERAYTTFLNMQRADAFDLLTSKLSRNGVATLAEEKIISNYIKVATGRGDMGKLAGAAVPLSTVFFAPRYVLSRFQLLTGQPLWKMTGEGSWRVRRLIAKEYGRSLTGVAVVLGLGIAAGATVETDPRSSDFMKLKFGNTRVDPMMGLSQATVLLSREISGRRMDARRRLIPIRGKVPYGQPNSFDIAASFLRSKLSPFLASTVNVATGKDVVGNPATIGTEAKAFFVPLSFGDVADAMKEEGVPKDIAIALAAIFGMNVQNYDSTKRTRR